MEVSSGVTLTQGAEHSKGCVDNVCLINATALCKKHYYLSLFWAFGLWVVELFAYQ